MITEKEVCIKFLFFKIKCYKFLFFDYCFTTIDKGKGGSSEILYLVKDKKLKLRITSGMYKNYFQLKDLLIKKINEKEC